MDKLMPSLCLSLLICPVGTIMVPSPEGNAGGAPNSHPPLLPPDDILIWGRSGFTLSDSRRKAKRATAHFMVEGTRAQRGTSWAGLGLEPTSHPSETCPPALPPAPALPPTSRYLTGILCLVACD